MAVRLGWCLLPLLLLVEGSDATHHDNTSRCQPGLLLPVWLPQDNLNLGDRVSRGLVYFFAMIYLFIGVSIISDRFMASIEVITSQEKEVTIKKKNGETQIVVVRVWNETVANLTLMALGSSAPEILLSIIEIGAKKFEAGELGPGTIVGSAAYNLFVIIALCVSVIPDGEVRKIKHLRVFFVTATWSVFAYVWLYLIVSVISEGEIEVWEGLLTFMFFPATVLTAWIADRRLLIYKYLHKNYRMNRRGMIVETEGDIEMVDKMNHVDGGLSKLEEDAQDDDVREFEHNRREYITTLRDLRKKYPLMELEQIEVLAQEEVLNKGPKSRAFYRIQATRKMVGGGNIMKKIQERAQSDLSEVKAEILKEEESGTRVFFDPGHYTVMESVGQFEVTVVREGDLGQTLLVDYTTEDGSAEAGSDYVGANGTLTFAPGDVSHTFSIEVIDDDLFEEDEHFYVRLLNLRVQEQSNGDASLAPSRRMSAKAASPLVPQLVSPSLATVMILDDDHGGIFGFAEKDTELVESVGQFDLKVIRYSGARGKVSVHYSTEDGTGKAGKEYEEIEGDLIFENNESEQTIPLRIIDEDSYEKDVLFYVQLEEPKMIDDEAGLAADAERKKPEERTEQDKMALLGRPKLGDHVRAQIRVKESKEFKNTVDKLVQRANASILIGTSSWKEQFIEALSVSPGDDGGGDGDSTSDGGDDKNPSCGDYVMHFVTLFWKLLFAFVPPTDMAKGYLCFVVSILGIGIVAAVIGDVASSFGCTLGIQDSVTAIAFVALGTSIPDMLGGYLSFVVSIAGIGALTAVIGDVASHFGCTVGLEDAVTAIAFVALGTSVPDLMNGVLCFCVSISCIGVLTAVIGDTASHFGCTLGIRDAVTAISVVAMGTSIPDTFASKVAAIQDKYADASVGNVTGSNAVNVFLGIGIAWSIAAIYHACNGTKFLVDPGNMAFSVTIFCTEAFVAILILVLRRSKLVGGELGGPKGIKYFTSAVLFSLWLIYVILSSLEVYDVIEGF